MSQEVRETGKCMPMSKLATFLRGKIDRREITQSELEIGSGIPDSTLSRIINGQVEEPKASQIAQIAQALGMPFWQLMQIAGYTTAIPGDPSEEAQRIAIALESQPDLRQLFDEAENLQPEDRDAVRAYILLLQRQRQERAQTRQRRKKPRPDAEEA